MYPTGAKLVSVELHHVITASISSIFKVPTSAVVL